MLRASLAENSNHEENELPRVSKTAIIKAVIIAVREY
jgi:hypothetical protein